MDLSYPPEAEGFRTEIRAWLEENLPEGWGTSGFRLDGDERRSIRGSSPGSGPEGAISVFTSRDALRL